jgi:branched-chain amino acid transport system ATP-binding protein
MSSQLQIVDVSKSFGGVQAVSRVSLDVRQGEILSVIGPNGAGKTTLLNMISGFYHPDSGRITMEGADLTQSAPSRIAELGVARTFQNIALFRGMTVLENLMLGRHVRMKAGVLSSFLYWGFARREEVTHRRRVEDIVDFLRIQDLRRRPTGSLAYGLQKRLELGRALALDPKILLLDEPMGGCNHEEK